MARSSIFSVLDQAIHVGRLAIHDSDGAHYFGKKVVGGNDAQITIVDPNFWMRVLMSGDLGCKRHYRSLTLQSRTNISHISVSEAYMVGEIQVHDLRSVMNVGPFITIINSSLIIIFRSG